MDADKVARQLIEELLKTINPPAACFNGAGSNARSCGASAHHFFWPLALAA